MGSRCSESSNARPFRDGRPRMNHDRAGPQRLSGACGKVAVQAVVRYQEDPIMPPRSRSGAGSQRRNISPRRPRDAGSSRRRGKRATVYLREATPSLASRPDVSAKVVSVEGTRSSSAPRGQRRLPFEAEELRMTRKAPEPVKSTRPAKAAAPAPKPAALPRPSRQRPPRPSPRRLPRPSPCRLPSLPPHLPRSPHGTPGATAPAPRRAKKAPAGVSVTIHAGAENDWTVTVTHGAKRPGRPLRSVPTRSIGAMRESVTTLRSRRSNRSFPQHARLQSSELPHCRRNSRTRAARSKRWGRPPSRRLGDDRIRLPEH